MTTISIKPAVIAPARDGAVAITNVSKPELLSVQDVPVEHPVAVQPYDLMQMTGEWMGIEYAELSALLVYLKFLQAVYQTSHWTARGDSFYGDHLLFQRLYDSVTEQIDALAEKVVGVGTEKNVDLFMQVKQLSKLVSAHYNMPTVPCPDTLPVQACEHEQDFITAIDCARNCLNDAGLLTYGVDNFLAGLADEHEENVYLLKQRIGRAGML